MRNILIGIGVVGVIMLFGLPDIISDYSWANTITEQKQKDGWTVASTNNNIVDITQPWTIVKTPVSQLGFVKPNEIKKVEENIYFTKILWVSYEGLSRTNEEEFTDLINCKNKQMASVKNNGEDIKDPEWHTYEAGMPGSQVISFVCKDQ